MIRDKYRIDAFIADGSMATVYSATHRNGSRVALKILHRELAQNPAMGERFRREGYFANAIGHSGVVRAIDDDVAEDGCAFIVMELLEGENLEERRARLGGRVPISEALEIADAMLDVLSTAHDHEVLHRDLKPENVFITRKNEVKLLDFGVARFNDGRSSSDMTAVGMVLGTPAFMPPEQALGRREDVDARSDIWAVGATLFTVMTGETVHAGGDAKSKLIATARTPARPIRDVAPEVPRAVAAVIDRALAFDKAERWADAKAMREALRSAQTSLDGDVTSRLEPAKDMIPRPVPTRRTEDEEPTLATRSPAPGHVATSLDSTSPKSPVTAKRPDPASDDVITSAPPVTLRDPPRSMATRREPTFSFRADPGLSRPRTQELGPSTQRIPRPHADASAPATQEPVAPRPGDAASLQPAHTPWAAAVHPTDARLYHSAPPAHSPAPPQPGAMVAMSHPSPPAGAGYLSSPPMIMPPESNPPADHGPEQGGPVLATDAPNTSGRGARIFVPILIGLLAAAATYAVIVRKHALHASQVAVATHVVAPPQVSASTAPAPAESSETATTASSSVAPPASAASSVAATPSSTAPKKRRPRAKPAVPSTAATATEAPNAEPAPTPNDTMPRRDPG
jgi:serine/threonine-protein kinase